MICLDIRLFKGMIMELGSPVVNLDKMCSCFRWL